MYGRAMKGIALAAVVAACGSNDGRIDKLETRVEVLEVENDHLSVEKDALWKEVNKLIADDRTNVANWWCVGPDLDCWRDNADCERDTVSGKHCIARSVAWCDRQIPYLPNTNTCTESLSSCVKQQGVSRCVGFE